MQYTAKRGFTLIEILIVIAIIGVLASVVLVGLGPTQKQGRDARRISDLKQVQNVLELYFQKCRRYPGDETCAATNPATWAELQTSLQGAGIGLTQSIPNDPVAGKTFSYGVSTDGTSYILRAGLESPGNQVLSTDVDGVVLGLDCNDDPAVNADGITGYCLQL